jgi:hypothetical protein
MASIAVLLALGAGCAGDQFVLQLDLPSSVWIDGEPVEPSWQRRYGSYDEALAAPLLRVELHAGDEVLAATELGAGACRWLCQSHGCRIDALVLERQGLAITPNGGFTPPVEDDPRGWRAPNCMRCGFADSTGIAVCG